MKIQTHLSNNPKYDIFDRKELGLYYDAKELASLLDNDEIRSNLKHWSDKEGYTETIIMINAFITMIDNAEIIS